MTDKEKIELIKDAMEHTIVVGLSLGYLSFEMARKVEKAAKKDLLEKFGLEEKNENLFGYEKDRRCWACR